MKAQKALDRQRMEHDQAAEEWKTNRERDKGSETPVPAKAANGSGHATPNGKVEQVRRSYDYWSPADEKDEKPTVSMLSNLPDTAEVEEKAALRLKQLEELRAEHTALQQRFDDLQVTVS